MDKLKSYDKTETNRKFTNKKNKESEIQIFRIFWQNI
jgi:hypothetical protein